MTAGLVLLTVGVVVGATGLAALIMGVLLELLAVNRPVDVLEARLQKAGVALVGVAGVALVAAMLVGP